MIPCYRPNFGKPELMAALFPIGRRQAFESAFAELAGARFAVSFSSGSAAIVATLKALGLRKREVVVPAYSCRRVPAAILASGNRPAFVDIGSADYNMDVDQLAGAISSTTKAVLATHMYGYPADIDSIRSVIGDRPVYLLEDSAQASPLSVPLRGHVAVFSTGRAKPMSTVCGGLAVTDSNEIYEKLKTVQFREMNRHSARTQTERWARFLGSYLVYRKPVYAKLTRYRSWQQGRRDQKPGETGSREAFPKDLDTALTGFQARVGLVQIKKLGDMSEERRRLAKVYFEELKNSQQITLPAYQDQAPCALYTIRVAGRDTLQFSRRMRQRGVIVDQSYDYVLPELREYRCYGNSSYPNAAAAAAEVINLPFYPGLGEEKARFIAACIRESLDEAG